MESTTLYVAMGVGLRQECNWRRSWQGPERPWKEAVSADPVTYLVLECWEDDDSAPHVTLQEVPEFEDVSWISGSRIDRSRVPRPITIAIEGEPEAIVPPIL